MTQIDRIRTMEENLTASAEAVRALTEALAKYESVQGQMKRLFDYYGSNRWMKDYEDDEAGKLPEDLARGVLSEDAVYNLIADNKELVLQMLKIVQSQVKNVL